MKNILQYILPVKSLHNFTDTTFRDRYEEWNKPSQQVQISAATLLTALLYIIFALLDKSWASEQVQALMMQAHLFIIVPMLLTISYLAYKKRFYNVVMLALAISPVIAMSCHVYIASKLSNYAPYLMEGYLSILWTFIVSGMTFRYALVSAIFSSIILLVASFYFMSQTDIYVMHVFWIGCSFSFGFLGALMLSRSRKAIFMSHQELHRYAITDSLTGVFNRNQLNSVLSEEIGRGRRYNKTFGILILDIDHFKSVNDSLGHNAGDEVLKQTAEVLSKSIRENDTLIRWGGEEFIVVALEVDEQGLIQFCDKLRKTIESENYGAAGKITVSVGATLFRNDDTQDTMISRADKALYEAKEKGRNIIVCV